MFPILHTFIHFGIAPLHASRSLSAPPVLTSREAKAPRVPNPRKAKIKRKQKIPDADDDAIKAFAKERIREQWSYLASKACKNSPRQARLEVNMRRHQFILPKNLFLDLAFYAFQQESAASTLITLFQEGVLTEPIAHEVHICCSRRQLQRKHGNPIRKVIEEGKKLLEVAQRDHFAVVFNNDIIIYLLWNPEMTVSAVIQKIMQVVVIPESSDKAIAMHRNTTLREGKLGDLGLTAGSTIAIIPV